MDIEDGGKLGTDLAALYMRLRDELGHDHSGMDPNDRTRAPIAMAILAYADTGIANVHDIEVSVRRVFRLPGQTINLPPFRSFISGNRA
jgi:hypothetical protein